MALAKDVNEDVDPPSPRVEGQGTSAPLENKSYKLQVAANNPDYGNGDVTSSVTRAGLVEYLAKRQAAVLEILAGFCDQSSLNEALLAVANDLHHRFQCERVVLGLVSENQLVVKAISQQAVMDLRTNEARLIREAMQEACDQQSAIQYPEPKITPLENAAHQALSLGHAKAQIYTIPLCYDERIIGAIQLQRRSDQQWSTLTLELLGQITLLVAPLIEFRDNAEQGIASKIRTRVRNILGLLKQPKHLAAKAASLMLLLILALAYVFPVEHTVKATAELVATERRLVSAPTSGFINRVLVNAGDQVRAGDVLLQLETRELELQMAGQENERLGIKAELRSAMASYDRKEVAIIQARISQLEAELALTEQQISRSTITAPVNGIIVSGDMSQILGSSVERGEALMELSPADGYEVQALVHEVDMPFIQTGQAGTLSLRSDPGNELPVQITAIHPIAIASEGVSRFLVQTALQQHSADLRPGQTGIVKLNVGDATLLWVWTHRFMEWSRQRLWEWFG